MGIIHTAKKNLPSELFNKLKKRKLVELSLKGVTRQLTKSEEAQVRNIKVLILTSLNIKCVLVERKG